LIPTLCPFPSASNSTKEHSGGSHGAIQFAIIIGETYETDLRIYGSVAIAYTIPSWAFDENRTSSPTLRKRLTEPFYGAPRSGSVLDDYWRKARWETEAKMLKLVRQIGTMTAEKNMKMILRAHGKQKLAKSIILQIASALPDGKRTEADAMRSVAQEISYQTLSKKN
jgi:hypothetical protein